MTAFLNLLLQNSLSGTVLILVILLFRRMTGDLSKLYVRILWLAALLVLLLPPVPLRALYTVRNLMPETEGVFTEKQANTDSGLDRGKEAGTEMSKDGSEFPESRLVPDGMGTMYFGAGENGKERAMNLTIGLTEGIFLLWAFGAAMLAGINMIQWVRLKKKISAAVLIRRNVWITEEIAAPFVMPGLPSRIYIPQELETEKEQLEDILKHESRHIRNGDPWIKCIAVLALVLHWFNPFVWLAFRLMSRDMEMYCDECVLLGSSMEEKKHYAQTLLDFACKGRGFSPILYFGESSTKSRIRHILGVKRPHMLISLLLLLMIGGCGISFLTTGEEETGKAAMEPPKEELLPENLSGGADAGETDDSAGDGGEADEEEEFWTEKAVVGIGPSGAEAGFDETAMTLMDETSTFSLYGMHEGEAMAVRTPEGLVYAEVPVISNYEIEPLLLEQDFDDDGEEELAIITYVLHGTGISVRSLFMVDHTGDGSWKIFQYRDQDYMAELTPHFYTKYTEDGVRLVFDGVPTGVTEETDQEQLDNKYGYYAGSQIDFRPVERKIFLRAQLAGYSDISFAGIYVGHELDAEVRYLGEGKWELADIRYADAGITEVIENAVPLYLSGRTREVNEHYTIPHMQLSDFGETSQKVEILSITYPAENLDSGETEAYVTVRRDGDDSFDFLSVPLKRTEPDKRWRIAGEIWMEK